VRFDLDLIEEKDWAPVFFLDMLLSIESFLPLISKRLWIFCTDLRTYFLLYFSRYRTGDSPAGLVYKNESMPFVYINEPLDS